MAEIKLAFVLLNGTKIFLQNVENRKNTNSKKYNFEELLILKQQIKLKQENYYYIVILNSKKLTLKKTNEKIIP